MARDGIHHSDREPDGRRVLRHGLQRPVHQNIRGEEALHPLPSLSLGDGFLGHPQ